MRWTLSIGPSAALLALATLAPAAGHAEPLATPETVSPGALEAPVGVRQVCPTFSWASATNPKRFRVRVVELEAGRTPGEVGATERTVVEATLAGGARSWTPSASRCLQRGRSYSWSVQTETDGGWGEPSRDRLFRVPGEPSPEEVEWALAVLERHLGSSARLANSEVDPSPIGVQAETAGAPGSLAGDGRGSIARRESVPTASLSSPPAFVAEGLVEVGALRAVDSGAGEGGIHAEGDILLPLGQVSAPEVRITHQNYTTGGVRDDSAVLCSPRSGVLSGGFGASCGDPWRYGLRVEENWARSGIDANGGMEVTPGSWTGDDGGAGVTYVPSYIYVPLAARVVNMDENDTMCPGGGLVVGVRFWETDVDQIGLQVKCTHF